MSLWAVFEYDPMEALGVVVLYMDLWMYNARPHSEQNRMCGRRLHMHGPCCRCMMPHTGERWNPVVANMLTLP